MSFDRSVLGSLVPKAEVLRPVGLSLGLAGASAVLSLVMFALVARASGPDRFGLIAMAFSAASFLAVFALAGQEFLAVRSWSEYVQTGRHGLARGVIRFGWTTCALGAAAAALAAAVLAWHLEAEPLVAVLVVAFVVTQMFCLYSSQLARVVSGIFDGVFHRDITWKAMVALAAGAALLAGAPFSAAAFFAVAAAGSALAVLLHVIAVRRALPEAVRAAEPLHDRRTWTARSFRIWIASVLEASSRHLEVVLLGIVLDPMAAGLYFAASRLANVFAVVTDGMNSFSTKCIPELYFGGQHARLDAVLKHFAAITTALTLAGLAAIAVLAAPLLGLFEASYAAHADVLLVLAAGTALNALVGPAPGILLLLGRETAYLVRIGLGLLARAACIVLFGALYGPFGAAAGVAAVTVATGLLLLFACRRLTGLDPSPFAFVGRRSAPDAAPAGGLS